MEQDDIYHINFAYPQTLLNDYNRLVTVLKFLEYTTTIQNKLSNRNNERINIRKHLENWFIEVANLPVSETTTTDVVVKSLNINNTIVTSLLNKLKKLYNNDTGVTVYNHFMEVMQQFINNPTLYNLPLVYYNNDKIILVSSDLPDGSYAFDLPIEIYYRLTLAHYAINKNSRFVIDDIYHLMFRYQSMLAYGNQWAVPKSIYTFLYEKGFNYEAFASPINSVMLTLGTLNNKPFAYGSLFKDTDSPFGSYGSFFDLVLPDTGVFYMTVNPPFIPDIENTINIKLKQLLNVLSRKLTICINIPGELQNFNDLTSSIYYRGGVTLPVGKNFYMFKDYVRLSNFPATYLFMSNDAAFTSTMAAEYSSVIVDLGTINGQENLHNKDKHVE